MLEIHKLLQWRTIVKYFDIIDYGFGIGTSNSANAGDR